jgi:hypothetical protein
MPPSPTRQKTKVAVCSLFRNSARYVDYYRAVISAQARDDIELVFSFIEGDSTDDTFERLAAWAREDPRVMLSKVDIEPFADFEERVRKWAMLGNLAVEAALETDCDRILWCESDLALPLDLIEQLVRDECDIVAPAIFLGGQFYDTWGFRGHDGVRFTNEAPYHALYQPHALVELKSVGSVVLFDREIFDFGVRFRGTYEDGLLVGSCHDAGALGYRTWMDSRVAVLHPTTLWKGQQYKLAQVEVDCADPDTKHALEEAAREIESQTDIALGCVELPGDHPVFAPVHAIVARKLGGKSHTLSVKLASEANKRYTLVLTDGLCLTDAVAENGR